MHASGATPISPPKPHKPPSLAWPTLAAGILAISSAAILIRKAEAPALVIGTVRLLTAAILLSPAVLIIAPREWAGLQARERWALLASGAALGLHFVLWIQSLKLTTVASSVVLATTNPIFVGLASRLILREALSRRQLLAIVLAMAGSVIIAAGDLAVTGEALLGDLMALVSAMAISVHLLLGRYLRRRLSNLAYIWPCYSIAGVLLLAATLLAGLPLFGYTTATYGYMALLGIIPQLIGHSALNWALGYFSPLFVTIAILGEPLGASALAFILLDEVPAPTVLLGTVLIIAGIILAGLAERAKSYTIEG